MPIGVLSSYKSVSPLGVPADLQSGETPSGLPHLRKFFPLLLRNNLEDFG